MASVSVTAYDPTFDGNQMQAFDGNGLIGTVPFPGNQRPGTLSTQTRTLAGSIRSIQLTPAPRDYVAYSMIVTFRPRTSITLALSPSTQGLLAPSYASYQSGICNVPSRASTRDYEVHVTSTNPDSIAGRDIAVSLTVVPNSGSHVHDESARPVGSLDAGATSISTTVRTDASGTARFTFYAPEPAGQYVVSASAVSATTVRDTITVGYALTALSPYPSYTLVGDRAIHPNSHFASATMAAALRELSDSLVAFSGTVLGVNDESIVLGGLFDLQANWSTPHCSHRRGTDADIRDRVLTPEEVRFVRLKWARTPGAAGVLREADHIHLKSSR